MSPEDIVAAYLFCFQHDPEISAEDERLLSRRIAIGKIRVRWAISRCEVIHRTATETAWRVLSGSLNVEEVVYLRDRPQTRERLFDIVKFFPDRRLVSRAIRRTPFLPSRWQAFIAQIKLAAAQDTSMQRPLHQILRGRRDAETAAATLVRANLRPGAGYAARYLDLGLDLPDLIRAVNIGLMRAAYWHDYRLGCRFGSYARRFIRQTVWDKIYWPMQRLENGSHWVN